MIITKYVCETCKEEVTEDTAFKHWYVVRRWEVTNHFCGLHCLGIYYFTHDAQSGKIQLDEVTAGPQHGGHGHTN